MAETTTRLTADELMALPDDGWQYELRKGELIRIPPAGGEHGRFEGRLFLRIGHHAERENLGDVYTNDTGFRLQTQPDTLRAPDIAFVRRERALRGDAERGYLPMAPDLAVEIVSPSDSAEEIREKVADYLHAGTRLVWVFYPRTRSVTIYRADGTVADLSADAVLSGEDVLLGFSCRLADLFAEL